MCYVIPSGVETSGCELKYRESAALTRIPASESRLKGDELQRQTRFT